MKKTQIPYVEAEISVILLGFPDIITASGGNVLSNDEGINYDDGGWT